MLFKKLVILAFLAVFVACNDALVDPIVDNDTSGLQTSQECNAGNMPC